MIHNRLTQTYTWCCHQKMLLEGPREFEGGINARKYMVIAKISKATATRGLQHLWDLRAFALLGDAGGRCTGYRIRL